MKKFTPKSPTILAWEATQATLPGLFIPLKTVSEANMCEHWAKKARRKKGQRARVAMELLIRDRKQHLRKPAIDLLCFGEDGLTVLLTRYAHNTLDDDNLVSSMKAVRDEIAAWVGVDDKDPRYNWMVRQAPAPFRAYGVRIEFLASPKL